MQITIDNAVLTSEDGTVTKGTITGEAKLADPTTPPGTGDIPTHPILLPPVSDNPNVFFVLCYCANPPPPHWEWIAFMPGDDVPERPTPEPPPVGTTPPGIKPPPASGGWGYWPGVGWVYYPGPTQPSPKRR